MLTYNFLEFIHLLSSEANEFCEKENKKTISAEHIVKSLQVWTTIINLKYLTLEILM